MNPVKLYLYNPVKIYSMLNVLLNYRGFFAIRTANFPPLCKCYCHLYMQANSTYAGWRKG